MSDNINFVAMKFSTTATNKRVSGKNFKAFGFRAFDSFREANVHLSKTEPMPSDNDAEFFSLVCNSMLSQYNVDLIMLVHSALANGAYLNDVWYFGAELREMLEASK